MLRRDTLLLPLLLLTLSCAGAGPSAPPERARADDDPAAHALRSEPAAAPSAPPAAVAEAPAPARFALDAAEPSAERLRADVAWLADDAREGRRAGQAGEAAAARWIAERLESLGLEPAGDDGWLQGFEVPLPVRDGGGSTVKWIGVKASGIDSGREAAVPLYCSAAGHARGRLVFAGYGIVNEERGRDDYAEIDPEGAVVAILRGSPGEDAPPAAPDASGEENPHGASAGGWGASATILHKVIEAKQRGAVAVLFLPRDADEPMLGFDAGRSGEAGIPAVTIPWSVFERLREADEVEVEADIVRAHGRATNVLGRLRGTSSERAIVVGAHFDHLGRGGLGSLAPDRAGEIHNGADDNASGTAVVLELARCLAAGRRPPCDVLFALWSGEELGLLGSEHWAQAPTVPLERIVLALNLDMVGRAGAGRLQVLGAGSAAPLSGWLAASAPASGLELAVNASGQGVGGSDHQTFLAREIPALHFFSGVHTDYHRPTDDVERFEADGARRVAELGLEVLACALGAVLEGQGLAYVAPPPSDKPSGGGGFRARFGSVPEYSFEGPGVLLAGTSPGGPAERGGLVRGDVVTGLGSVQVETIHDLMYALNVHKPGDVVLVRFRREGEERTLRVTLDSPDLE